MVVDKQKLYVAMIRDVTERKRFEMEMAADKESLAVTLSSIEDGVITTDVQGKEEPYLKYKLENVIISSFGFHGNSSGNPLPTEDLSLNYTKATWTYVVVNKDTGKKEGNVETMYDKEQAKAG